MTDYRKHSHIHCFEQEAPPCGIKGKHLRCCLCEKKNIYDKEVKEALNTKRYKDADELFKDLGLK